MSLVSRALTISYPVSYRFPIDFRIRFASISYRFRVRVDFRIGFCIGFRIDFVSVRSRTARRSKPPIPRLLPPAARTLPKRERLLCGKAAVLSLIASQKKHHVSARDRRCLPWTAIVVAATADLRSKEWAWVERGRGPDAAWPAGGAASRLGTFGSCRAAQDMHTHELYYHRQKGRHSASGRGLKTAKRQAGPTALVAPESAVRRRLSRLNQ